MSFHSSSSIYYDFFSLPSRALCVPSFTSNDLTRIFHNMKLDFLSNFSTLNLVVWSSCYPSLWYQLLMIYHRSNNRNTKSKTRQRKRKRRRSTTSKQSPHYQKTQDLTWFGNMPTFMRRRRNIYWKKYKSYNEISLTTLNSGILEFLLNSWHSFKRPPLGFI